MNEYTSVAVLICTNKAAGNQLAAKAASFINDPGAELGTFADDRMLSPQAWYAVVYCKPAFASVCQGIAENAAYTDNRLGYLKESPRNVQAQEWSAAKSIISAAVFDRSGYSRADAEAFIASSGYSIIDQEQP